ncbi:MAG TPA: bifunctional 2-C-methyl-D-erythritol 4-phosphate cytidylyltransferase/2-C-methyl-D-erythritol 2,4-cyclodiphosphate synthase [Pseudolabrys sp.]|nr:bifunctional 2-C-methyl-D-erythritol 4-phosphate cytidylyltransferase/2-C-methyl-D-erythritol 2,4-cyclodiphosphate synthase [Pseudolabrys sp.]
MVGVAAVLVAAGRGTRAGEGVPKQFRPVGGEIMLTRALSMLAEHPTIGAVQPVIHPEDTTRYDAITARKRVLPPVFGGATRQASVRAGLEALAARAPEIVLIHDAARPFASARLVDRAIAAATRMGAAVPALAVSDTVKTVKANGMIERTLDRGSLRLIQTPQAFAFAPLLDAHRKATAAGREDFTDDASLAEWAGLRVSVFEGESGNVKITNPEDFARAERERIGALDDVRTGAGIDVHAFGPGDHVWLGGLKIPHTQALTGHSDADVVLHAAVDAILGALADGDIGSHFPPSDPQWEGAASGEFLAFAVERVKARGGRIAHLDVTVVCEAPRIGPYRDAMRENIAALAGLPLSRVAVKATTSEQLGFTGRREGILALASATVRLPWE